MVDKIDINKVIGVIVQPFGRVKLVKKMNRWQRFLYRMGLFKLKIHGKIHDIDTSKFKEGDKLYLDPDKPGALTNHSK